MRLSTVPLVVLLVLATGTVAGAQTPATIVVESPRLTAGQPMPREYSPDGRNVSPPLTWRGLPAGTREIVVLCEDHGAGNPPPWVHWIVYDIPASAGGLPEAIPFDPADPMPASVAGAKQGNNSWNLPMYRGPAPPLGTVHDYDFTVLALNADVDLSPGLTRAELLAAIGPHVIGRGTLTATYTREPADPNADLD